MRWSMLLLLALVLVAGCKRSMDKLSEDTQVKPNEKFKSTQHWLTDQKGEQPTVHAPTGVVVNQGGGGGSGGAAQAVRQAVVRSVNEQEMKTIQQFIELWYQTNGSMPGKAEFALSLKKDAYKTYELVEANAIILTGTKSREGIWAYTYNPQSQAGEHIVATASYVGRMPAAELREKLKGQ